MGWEASVATCLVPPRNDVDAGFMIKSSTNEYAVRQLRTLLMVLAGLVLSGCSPAPQGATSQAKPAAELRKATYERTALDDYVAAPDTNYAYHLVSTSKGKNHTTYILEMTSQAWLTTNEVDRPLWKHWLNIVRPNEVSNTNGLLFISGGANGGNPPKSPDDMLVQIAVSTKSVLAELKMVPNQPLVFAGETEGRKEDSLIAYTWDKFLRTGDPKWPARLPMTKAAVRAMDTVTAFCATPEGGKVEVSGFVIAGGSKRGWTTWTTAAVDKRVVAIVPIVIDVLNMVPSMQHHYAAYGFWAPSVGNYSAFHIMDWMGTPENHALLKIEEPYSYRQRFTMPKLLINACGDQFFLPDSSQFYFADLPGVKYLRYVPNADHGLKGTDAYQSLTTFYMAMLNHFHLPEFSWTLEGDDAIRVNTKDKPNSAVLWQATNPDARDFRLETFGPKWQNEMLDIQGKSSFAAKVPKPAKGWTAFFVELAFPSSKETPDFKFTTQVRVVPDVLPYKFVPKGRPQQVKGTQPSASGSNAGR
jgi:PhoPQ-activated pathogenicity-related protein